MRAGEESAGEGEQRERRMRTRKGPQGLGSGWVFLAAGLVVSGCRSPRTGSPEATWLSREPEEQRVQLERHLRGFELAMVETGHRYIELHWAGRDANWEAAAYQVQKMRLAIENGLERRPKRAASARPFLAGPLVAMEQAVSARDPEDFAACFADLTEGCNPCHAMEKVPFFQVRPPKTRTSPVQYEAGTARDRK